MIGDDEHEGGVDIPEPDLRVNKREVMVRVFLDGKEWCEGSVFLYLSSRVRPGRERMSDLLKEEGGFLAFREEGGTRLLNVGRIHVVAAPAEEEVDELYGLSCKIDVEIEVAGGYRVGGRLFGLLPREGSRTKDLLNLDERFVRLSHGDEVYLINKSAIVSVRETGGGARG
jgi:hypothetical protein